MGQSGSAEARLKPRPKVAGSDPPGRIVRNSVYNASLLG